MATKAHTTVDHDEIRAWVEERGGRPSVVASTKNKGEGGILRIDFGDKEESLEEISWEKFFDIFEERQLAFLCEEETPGGEESYFNKFISRSGEAESAA